MKFGRFILITLALSSLAKANELINIYHDKVDECIAREKTKKSLTEENITVNDLKYILIIKNIRIAECSKLEESAYINSSKTEYVEQTLSQFNEIDLKNMSSNELDYINKLDHKLKDYNLEVNLLSIYEKLKENK